MARRMNRRKRAARAARPMKRNRRKTAVPRGITTSPNQMARVVETIDLGTITPNSSNLQSFQLTNFRRAHYMSAAFAFYRAAKCTYTYQPLFNVFQDLSGSSSLPNIYTLMNRQGDINLPQSAIDIFTATGSSPRKFNTPHKVSYKPNWTTPGMPTLTVSQGTLLVSNFIQGSQTCYNWVNKSSKGQKMYPSGAGANDSGVLTTLGPDNTTFASTTFIAPNSACDAVAYLGHDVFVEQKFDTNPNPVARVTLTVEWEFKGPIWNNLIRQDIITQ